MSRDEPRTMQFVIERRCPHRQIPDTIPVPMEFPRVIWVEVPESIFAMDCGGKAWLATQEDRQQVMNEFPAPPDRVHGVAVCGAKVQLPGKVMVCEKCGVMIEIESWQVRHTRTATGLLIRVPT